MKVALFALGGSYSHTNLAIRCLRPHLIEAGFEVVLIEGNAGDTDGALLDSLYFERADIYGFSCYIWNITKMLELAADLKRLIPSAKMIFGGPEVSFGTERFESLGFIDHIICGEGELALTEVCRSIREGKKSDRVIISGDKQLSNGILYRADEPHRRLMYYESSRGCPYSCAYCLSSASCGVASKSVEQTLSELYEFEAFDDDIIIKLVDRTFNFDISRANAIWRGLLDPKYTKKYHFEICASLLGEESFEILSAFPKDKIQLEVGLQSINRGTLAKSARHIDPDAVLSACRRVLDMGNIHIHLDLICGLPGDSFSDVAEAFDRAYFCCSLLQLGFLKLLHGTSLRRDAEKLGIEYRTEPPYEVLKTPDISYPELRRLHEISDLLERYRDGGKFDLTLDYTISHVGSPFGFFSGLCDYIAKNDGRQIRRIGQNDAYRLLFGYAVGLDGIAADELEGRLHEDYSIHEVRKAPHFSRKDRSL